MSNDVPLLTAEQAQNAYDDASYTRGAFTQLGLKAIATGRAVVVPRMSEAEARERFVASREAETEDWLGYLAALRDLGAIAPEGK